MDTTNKLPPQTEKDACLYILLKRIEDYRAMETFFIRFGIQYDKDMWRKKIGSLQKVGEYIKNH